MEKEEKRAADETKIISFDSSSYRHKTIEYLWARVLKSSYLYVFQLFFYTHESRDYLIFS